MRTATDQTVTVSNDNGISLVVRFSGSITKEGAVCMLFHSVELQIGGEGFEIKDKMLHTSAHKKLAQEISENYEYLFK